MDETLKRRLVAMAAGALGVTLGACAGGQDAEPAATPASDEATTGQEPEPQATTLTPPGQRPADGTATEPDPDPAAGGQGSCGEGSCAAPE